MTTREQRLTELIEARDRLNERIAAFDPKEVRRRYKTLHARMSRRHQDLLEVFHPRHTIYGDTPESQWARLKALDLDGRKAPS